MVCFFFSSTNLFTFNLFIVDTITVFCSHHNQYGQCTIEDYQDAKSGRNPSGMVRVKFDTFSQAVPFNTVHTWEEMKEQHEMDAFEPENYFQSGID